MKFNTKAIHAGQQPEPTSGAVMPPIFQTSTSAQAGPNDHQGYDYARVGNPTRTALEKLIAGLEGAEECACFASGVAAMDALIKMLRPGDHVIASNDLYGGSYRLFTQVFQPYGIDFSFVDMTDLSLVQQALRPSTKMIWIETPTNPLLRIVDIRALSTLARDHGAVSVVDNTFASPYLQRPLEHGADAVMHSATKYLAGHSDVIHGAVASSNTTIMENPFSAQIHGAVPGPMDCYLPLEVLKHSLFGSIGLSPMPKLLLNGWMTIPRLVMYTIQASHITLSTNCQHTNGRLWGYASPCPRHPRSRCGIHGSYPLFHLGRKPWRGRILDFASH